FSARSMKPRPKMSRSCTPPRWSPSGTLVVLQRRNAATPHTAASAAKVRSRTGEPMRVAVISDIHANLPALEAVAEAIEQEAPDAVWCLGDLVGYGAQPNECCGWPMTRADVCLAGNHDLGVIGTLDLVDFAGDAAVAATWTAGVLDEEAREWLAGLPSAL